VTCWDPSQASPERRKPMRRRSTCCKSALRAAPWSAWVMEADSIFMLCDLGYAAVAGAPGREGHRSGRRL